MISAFFKGIFHLVTKLFSLVMAVPLATITALFPSTAEYFGYITSYIARAITYVRLILDCLFVPRAVFTILFAYYEILASIYAINIVIKFGIKIYNKFKP